MRHNMFGDAYCLDADEVREAMDKKSYSAGFCYADIEFDDDEQRFVAEIKDNVTGATICYVEDFESRNDLRLMLVDELGFSNRDVNYM